MIGAVPSALDDIVRDLVDNVVPSPVTDLVTSGLGAGVAVPILAAVDDPPEMQPVVVPLIEPVPMLDCVPEPLQSVPCDRAADWLIAPDTLGTEVAVVPGAGTSVPMPDAGDVGIWLPPPGIVVALESTVLFGFAKVDGAIVVESGAEESGRAMYGTPF